ncbi:hypothetical protein [Halorientalis marina]|jgi:hypothetical protein|uniref:hypothetical protein n=1 Tax=Halorientalis marina TaxID=2931976 RepID=UPI001FF30743|nr:hypothetical protein [Halorientalis marina]
MERRTLALVGGVIVVIAAVAAGAVALGLAPSTGAPDSTGSPPSVDSSSKETENGNATYAFDITNLSECGQTCRDMTWELTNGVDERASNVTLAFEVYAGGNSTVWEGTESVGELDANATAERTTRIEVGIQDGLQIRGNDGDVTVITTVYADGERQTQFSDEDNVG